MRDPKHTERRILGVDVGGTFTDMFVLDEASQDVIILKVPSNRGGEAAGFMTGIAQATGKSQGASGITTIVHGTTVGTNALLERKVARTGLITTRGFRDVLEMRRRDRPQTWGLRGSFTPIISRTDRIEVDERVLADGTVHTPLDEVGVRAAVETLLAAECQAVCIFFVNAYANPENERRATALVRALWPNSYVSSAAEVLPEIREFERASTAALNACLQPVVGSYLNRLHTDLKQVGFEGEFLIVQSSGGVMSYQTAADLPVKTALSGPAAGVIACAAIATAAGYPNVITGDIGGTSFDVSLIANGEPAVASQTSIDFGLVIRSPMIQIETIGAGGGSIASIDAGGMLQVGPESAGSVPGPACYGKGNARPTVTDANVVLGRIVASRPLGGGLLAALEVDLAYQAIKTHVADVLGLDVLQAAEAILMVANAKMAGAMRLVSIEKGHDPREFAYMPFGGGGGLHACAMMSEVGLTTGIVPRYPGVTSALGCVMADMRHDAVQTVNAALVSIDVARMQAQIGQLRTECQARLDSAGVFFELISEVVAFDMLYQGQTHTISVSIKAVDLSRSALSQAFEQAYQRDFGRVLKGIPVRILNLRYSRIGHRPKFDLRLLAPKPLPAPTSLGVQRVFVNGAWVQAQRFDRMILPIGHVVVGPAILEQIDTTVWLEPGFQATVDDYGNLIVSRT